MQAKRYTDKVVGRPDVQGFVGALQGAQASRGIHKPVHPDAIQFADRVNVQLVLIGGPELASPMTEHNCGVIAEHTFTLKHLDENFFNDEQPAQRPATRSDRARTSGDPVRRCIDE